MRGLRASVYKDIKLFLSGAGLLSLLLPFLLLPALRWGVADLSAQSYVRPFPIAVRDLDGTVMSRSLISQLREIELFSEVRTLDADATDAQAIANGAAAVVTIPRDFFYEMYTMSECPASVTVNSGMTTESAIFRQIVRAVMDIVRADQAAGIGVYTLAYGDLTPELYDALYAETSEDLFRDALGRQEVFDAAVRAADPAGALQRRLAACVLAVSAMFFSLSAARTLPEELALGTLPRFRSAGGRSGAFLLSKFCAAFVLSLPLTAATAVLFPGAGPAALLLDIALLWAAFGVFTAIAVWTGDGAAAQRWGNLLLLLSLAAGGTLWPRDLLPGPLAWLGRLTPPYYAALGLEALAQKLPFSSVAGLLWPLPVIGAAGLVMTVFGLRRRQRGASSRPASTRVPHSATVSAPEASPAGGLFRRLTRLGLFKLRASAGGVRGLAALAVTAVLCGMASAAVQGDGADTLRLALCDFDGTVLSQELADDLTGTEGISCASYTLSRARRALLTGDVEGVVIIESGYAESLTHEEGAALRYEAAGSSLAAQGAREIVAGKVSAQRSRLRAIGRAQNLMGRDLTDTEMTALQSAIRQAERTIPQLYDLSEEEGPSLSALFTPGQMSFAALAALFTLLTAGSWFGTGGGRMAERRVCAMPRGRVLSYGSDCLALSLLGLLVMAAVLFPGGGGTAAGLSAAAAYALCAAALALALTRASAMAGRVDALAPFLALLLCLLGGCFLDIRALSPAVENAALLSPAGLAVRAAEDSVGAGLALLAEGAALFVLGMPRPGKKQS